jgi:hypothetical protein
MWIARAMRTAPIEPNKIIPAIEGLYAVSNLKKPRVVIVPSPLVMAFAYGAAAAVWYRRATHRAANDATRDAISIAARDATDDDAYDAIHNATRDATRIPTYDATRIATDDATRDATDGSRGDATDDAIRTAIYDATSVATRDATDDDARIATCDATIQGATAACREIAGELGIKCAARWYENYQGGNMWASYESFLAASATLSV